MRTLIKAGNLDALDIMGFGPTSAARVSDVQIEPASIAIGGNVSIVVIVENPGTTPAGALVDLGIHFVKANGSTSRKVFKGAEFTLDPGATREVRKRVSLAQHSTRTHYEGHHIVDITINGVTVPAGSFTLDGEGSDNEGSYVDGDHPSPG